MKLLAHLHGRVRLRAVIYQPVFSELHTEAIQQSRGCRNSGVRLRVAHQYAGTSQKRSTRRLGMGRFRLEPFQSVHIETRTLLDRYLLGVGMGQLQERPIDAGWNILSFIMEAAMGFHTSAGHIPGERSTLGDVDSRAWSSTAYASHFASSCSTWTQVPVEDTLESPRSQDHVLLFTVPSPAV